MQNANHRNRRVLKNSVLRLLPRVPLFSLLRHGWKQASTVNQTHALTVCVMAGFWPHAHFRFITEQEEESRAQRPAETGGRTSHELDALEAGRRDQLL